MTAQTKKAKKVRSQTQDVSNKAQYISLCQQEFSKFRQSGIQLFYHITKKKARIISVPVKDSDGNVIQIEQPDGSKIDSTKRVIRFSGPREGAVIAFIKDGKLHIGWSKCRTKMEAFNKDIALWRAVNRAFPIDQLNLQETTNSKGDVLFSFSHSSWGEAPNGGIPHTTKKYLSHIYRRALKVFNLS